MLLLLFCSARKTNLDETVVLVSLDRFAYKSDVKGRSTRNPTAVSKVFATGNPRRPSLCSDAIGNPCVARCTDPPHSLLYLTTTVGTSEESTFSHRTTAFLSSHPLKIHQLDYYKTLPMLLLLLHQSDKMKFKFIFSVFILKVHFG